MWSSSSLAGSPIELGCDVLEGTVDNIDWEKEGGPLPPERCYFLSENRSALHIRKGEKLDCGSYSCNVSNEISWKESSLSLIIVGKCYLTPGLQNIMGSSVAVLSHNSCYTLRYGACLNTFLLWPLNSNL